ncbi:hypothetical protein FS749_013432 [Ceratobasidium sp. UAMH 11750]|nr:hypothetical protein FS749_013432 [Ceratobasidium sp. UAMH 11750]
MSPPPGRRRSGAYAESEGSGLYTPSATDRPRSSFYSASNLTGRDNDTYVPTDTKESTVRGVRIAADSLRGTNSVSMLGDHDAFSTGYGSGRSEGRISTAPYSRRRTLSAVSPSSGLSHSGGLRRPKRDYTQSLSPAAPDRDRCASFSPVDGYSTASERLSVPGSGSQVFILVEAFARHAALLLNLLIGVIERAPRVDVIFDIVCIYAHQVPLNLSKLRLCLLKRVTLGASPALQKEILSDLA